MKVMFVVYEVLLGGHVLSACTTAREMRSRGHETFFAGKRGWLTPEIEREMPFLDVEIPVYHGTRPSYFTWRSLAAVTKLREAVRRHGVELIHAFDARSYLHCYLAGLLEKIPVLCTLCGGTDPIYDLPRAASIIVFSEEQKAKMVERFGWPSGAVKVIRNRLDMGRILSPEMRLDEGLAREARLMTGASRVMMISSFDGTKIRSVFQAIEAAEYLLERGMRLQLVLIGGRGGNHDRARERAQQVNRRHSPDAIILTGPVVNAFRLLQEADVVLGVGRSAFEGMAYGKPTLIVGENGFAGLVEPAGIAPIAYYNFSGRNVVRERPVALLALEIAKVLEDPRRAQELGAFAREFVMAEIDVRRGGGRIEECYRSVCSPRTVRGVASGYASFLRTLAPICYDNGVHAPKKIAKSMMAALRDRPAGRGVEAARRG